MEEEAGPSTKQKARKSTKKQPKTRPTIFHDEPDANRRNRGKSSGNCSHRRRSENYIINQLPVSPNSTLRFRFRWLWASRRGLRPPLRRHRRAQARPILTGAGRNEHLTFYFSSWCETPSRDFVLLSLRITKALEALPFPHSQDGSFAAKNNHAYSSHTTPSLVGRPDTDRPCNHN